MKLIIVFALGFITAKAFADVPVETCVWPNRCVAQAVR